MDALSDPSVSTVVVMTSTQVGKTEFLLNVIGFHIAQDPSPILVVQPTLEMSEAFSKDRIAPMLRDTPALKGKVMDARTRDSGNTLLHKTFPGGHLTIAGANSAAGLASRPIRILLADEVDRYPASAGTEGDPVSLARRRTATFWNRKIVLTSTPTVKGASRIEAEWELSDKRRFFVPCPHCAQSQQLQWKQVKWPDGKPNRARYFCEECGAEWSENERRVAIRRGEWRATGQGNGETAGFHLNEIYSPWAGLPAMARTFLDAKRSPETLKTWVNTALGELWEERGEEVEAYRLLERREKWLSTTSPAAILLITCGIDVQGDRIEVERIGWGAEEESWSIEHRVIYGDPSAPEIWRELDDYLLEPTTLADGRVVHVAAACIDTGGHYTDAAYRFVADKSRRRIWAIKGVGGPGRPIWPRLASRSKKAGQVGFFSIGVDAAKDIVYGRLRIENPGPGYCHFPADREPDWFDQLTSEIIVTKYVKGFPTRVWEPKTGTRQEALDCRVYGFAALRSMRINWGRLQEAALAARPGRKAPSIETTPPPPSSPPRDNAWFGSRDSGLGSRNSNWFGR